MIQEGSIINRRWLIQEKIGSFDNIILYKACRKFKLKEKVSRKDLVVKVSQKASKTDKFHDEKELFQQINKNTRQTENQIIPNYCYHHETDNEEITAFKMTGVSLFSYCKSRAGLLPIQEVIHIFLKTLSCIERLHSIGIAHRNIIPQIIWIGKNGSFSNVSFIDFRKAKMSQSDPNGKYSHSVSFQDRKNDLEMLCHCMMYVSDGCVSWADVSSYNEFPDCCTCLENEENRDLCPQCEVCFCYPRCFRHYLFYLRSVSDLSNTEYRVLQTILKMDVTSILT